jgi:hypothetical protein
VEVKAFTRSFAATASNPRRRPADRSLASRALKLAADRSRRAAGGGRASKPYFFFAGFDFAALRFALPAFAFKVFPGFFAAAFRGATAGASAVVAGTGGRA